MSEIRMMLDEIQELKRRLQALETRQEHPGFAASDVARLSQNNTFAGEQTIPNTGLHLLDTNDSHDLIIAPGSDLTADRTLILTTGDADRTVTLSGDLTVPATGTAALKTGAPTAGRVASWDDANTVEDAGFAASDVARLATANAFTKGQTVTPDTAGGNSLKLDTAASPTSWIMALYRNGTYKQSIRLVSDNFVEERRNVVSLANEDTMSLAYAVLFVEIFDASNGNYAEMFCGGAANTVTELVDTGGIFTTTKDTASSINVYYESSMYHIQNKRGAAKNLAVWIKRATGSV